MPLNVEQVIAGDEMKMNEFNLNIRQIILTKKESIDMKLAHSLTFRIVYAKLSHNA